MHPIILITGATRGIGFAAARQLSARGATVIIASRDAARADSAARQLGSHVASVPLDVTESASVTAAARTLADRFGKLDVLVNNGAVLLDHYEGLRDLNPAVLTRTLDTNVVGALRVTQAMLPLLEKSSAPRIINVASGAGQLDGEPQAWAPAYSISKTALNMLTQQLVAAFPGITTNSMCPGWCRTEMGGPEAPLTPDQGADTLVWLALEAPATLRGKFLKERQVIPW